MSLPQGTGDDEYVRVTQAALRESLEEHKPGLVLYDAGRGRARGGRIGQVETDG